MSRPLQPLSGRVTFCILLKMPSMIVRRPFPVACVLAALVLAGQAHGQDPRAERRPPPREAGERAPRNDALADSVRRVHSRTGGQVLSAERVPYDGRDINRVKVVDKHGRVRVYMDDPTTGLRRLPRSTRRNDD